jgi:hypothetical protein
MALSFKLTKANYDAMRSMSMTQRMQVAKNDEVGQWLLSLMTPTQLAELFPLYYQRMLPADISGFMKAMPTSMTMAKQKAIEEQLQNTASGASAGANMQAGGWRRKWQETMTAEARKKATPQLTEEQQKIYSDLKSTPMSIDDPRAKMFAGLNEEQLATVGVKRITQDGKDFFKYSAPTTTDEQVKSFIASNQRGGNDFFNSIIKAEGTAKHGDPYETSLGYMKSPKPLTEMTMAESLTWGDQVRASQGLNSSAKGAFQIVNTTQRSAMNALGIGMNEKFSPENQRRMAAWIAQQQGLGAWEGLKIHRDQWYAAQQAMNAGLHRQYGSDGIVEDYTPKNIELAREKLIRNMEAQRIGTLAEYTNAQLPAPGSPEAKAIVGDTKGANAVAQKIKDQFGNLSNPQCVALAKAYVGSNSSVTEWRRGSNVMDGTLKPGTPIATFMDRQGNPSTMYDGGQGVGAPGNHTTHAAVFLDYQRDGAGKITGIRVMEQYKGSGGAHERTYPVGGFGTNNAANYHSINDKSGSPLGSTNPMVQNAAVDPPKTPLADYTSKVPMQANPPPKPVEAKPENKDNAQPPKQVKPNATGGVNKINTEQITAYPIGGAQGDNAVVVNAQQQPLFTMNTNERMLIDPKSDTAQVLPDQKPQLQQPQQNDMSSMMDEFKATVQDLKNQFTQNDPGKSPEPNMPNKETFSKDTAQGHVLDNMNDLSKEWYSTPSMKRAAFRTGGVETGDPVSNFHYSHGNKS